MEIRFAHKDIEKFIRNLEKPTIAKVLRSLDLLETFGEKLGMPQSKAIGSNLFELRVRGLQEIRLLYTFHSASAIVLHGFIKKSQKIPAQDLALARKRAILLDQ